MNQTESYFEELFNEAGAIASELNESYRGRCGLLVWFAALRMAGKLLLEKECASLEPPDGIELTMKVTMLDEMISNMTIVLCEVQPGEMPSNRVRAYQVGDSKPGERS